MFFKIVRLILGKLILVGDAISRPKPIQRDESLQNEIDKQAKRLSLYQFHACPFCVKVRRTIRRLNLPILLVDAKDELHNTTLVNQGGKHKVPCLRIETEEGVEWMYESEEIIAYLEKRFA